MKIIRLTSPILLWVIFVCVVGCATPNPLAGWKRADYNTEPDKAIVADYQDYIQKLPLTERKLIDSASVSFYKNEACQYAIKIEIPLNGVWQEHVLIYGRDNDRIKVIKYSDRGYRS
jgi:hypothetical protein